MKILLCIAAIFFIVISFNLQAKTYCGERRSSPLGPFDYNEYVGTNRQALRLVNKGHFTSNVENLISGRSTIHIGGDLAYALAQFPNHHRVLVSLSKLSLRDKTMQPRGASHSTLCYFIFATEFKPDDAVLRAIFSNYLLQTRQLTMAIEQLKVAIIIKPENPTYNYNLGLMYIKKKEYSNARKYAKKAYALGFPLPGLRKQLIAAGKWK